MSGIDDTYRGYRPEPEPLSAHIWISRDRKTANFCDAELNDFAQMTKIDHKSGEVAINILSDKDNISLRHNPDKLIALCAMIEDARYMLNMFHVKSCKIKIIENPENAVLNHLFAESLAMYRDGQYEHSRWIRVSHMTEDYLWYPNLIG